MVLDGLEKVIKAKYHKTYKNGKAYFPKVNYNGREKLDIKKRKDSAPI
jgi:hypothetical protein